VSIGKKVLNFLILFPISSCQAETVLKTLKKNPISSCPSGKKLIEANPINWINQSLRTGRGPPDSKTKAIGWSCSGQCCHLVIY